MARTSYVIYNEFFSINLFVENKFADNYSILSTFLEPYIHISKHHSINTGNYIYVGDFIEVSCNEINITYESNNIILLKRIIIDVCNKYLEKTPGFFLHSSSVACDDNGFVFIGEKGAGKTETMLNLLNTGFFNFSANDRTGVFLKNGVSYIFGNPSAMYVHATTIEHNDSLKAKILPLVDRENYETDLKDGFSSDSSKKIYISSNSLIANLNVNYQPISKLKCIFFLSNADVNGCQISRSSFTEFQNLLGNHLLPSVNENRPEIENILPYIPLDFSFLEDDQSVSYYNVKKRRDNDFTKELLLTLHNDGHIK